MSKGLLISAFAVFIASAEYSQGKQPYEFFPAEVSSELAGQSSRDGKMRFADLGLVDMLLTATPPPVGVSACQPMNITVTVSSAGNNSGIVEILAPTDAKLKVYLLAAETGKPPVEVTMTGGKIRNVATGQYDLILQDIGKKYCNELRRVTVN